MPGKSIGFVINCDVSALILVCGEQQVRCDNGCAEISTVQTGQLSRCHTGNEYIVYSSFSLSRNKHGTKKYI